MDFEKKKLEQVRNYNLDLVQQRLDYLQARRLGQRDRPQAGDGDYRYTSELNSSTTDTFEMLKAMTQEERLQMLNDTKDDDEFTAYVKEYFAECRIHCRRLPAMYQDNIFHPNNLILDACDLSTIQECISSNISGKLLIAVLKTRCTVYDVKKTIIAESHKLYKYAMRAYREYASDPDLWMVNHPILGLVVKSVASYTAFIAAISLIGCIINLFRKKKKKKSKNQSNDEDEVDDDNLDILEEQSQMSTLQVSDQAFIEARLNNQWGVVVRRTFYDNSKKVISTIRTPCKLTMLSGRWGEMVWHGWKNACDMKKFSSTILVEVGLCPLKTPGTKPLMWFRIDDIESDDRHKEVDRIYLKFPPPMYESPNIIKYLPSRKDKEFVEWVNSGKPIDMLFIRKQASTVHWETVRMSGGHTSGYDVQTRIYDCETGDQLEESERITIDHKESYVIDTLTMSGECGQLGFIVDNNRLRFSAKNPVYQHPILFYHHHSLKNAAGRGAGNAIWLEDVEFLLEKTYNISDPLERITEDMDSLIDMFGSKAQSDEDDSANLDDPGGQLARHHRLVGTLKPMNVNYTSSIKKSEFYPVFDKTRKPVKLYDHMADGELIKPMAAGRYQYGANTQTTVNFQYVEAIAEMLSNDMINKSSPIEHREVLTVDQVLEGDPVTHTASVDRSTSCGFSLNYVKNIHNYKGKGKYWIFGNGEKIDLTSIHAANIQKAIVLAELRLDNGDRMMNIYADCLKDELRPSGKLARLFCSADFIYLIQCKRYFGPWAGWIYENRIKNGIAIGINPTSSEWKAMYETLKSNSTKAFAGDFEKFDKWLLAAFIHATRVSFRAYYGNVDPVANRKRELLFEDMVHSIHAVQGINGGERCTLLYEWLHGNTSGNFLTAIINSIANKTMCVYAMADVLLESLGGILIQPRVDYNLLKYILNRVCIMVYGDDNLMTINDIPQIDFYTFQRSIGKLGLNYTDELKGTNGEVPPYRELKDCNFIARGFVEFYYNAEFYILAPLRIHSILESVLWYKGNIDSDELCERVEILLQELSFRFDVETLRFKDFELYAPRIIEAMYKTFGRRPLFCTWKAAFESMLERESPLYSPMAPLTALEVHEIIAKAKARAGVTLLEPQSGRDDASCPDLNLHL